MTVNYIKHGPDDRAGTLDYLRRHYPEISAETLVGRAENNPTGMASQDHVWVSALVTLPGKYIIEYA